ncbi:cardiolipin synthase [Candidatus Izemoplasma sp. B36]|uniref:cardiolipin synthase n=1 Tax=Candidatus Izemoplasma sp. B36 TaxID=3242468 RepID=UPI00355647C0
MKRGYVVFGLLILAELVYTFFLIAGIYIDSLGNFITNRIFLYILLFFVWIISLGLIIRVLLKPSYAYNKSHWILILLLNPFVGIVFYYIFARDFQIRKLSKQRPLLASKSFLGLEEITNPNYNDSKYGKVFEFIKETTGRTVYQKDTHLEILNNGDEFFPRLIDELHKAKEYIFMEFYIVKNDNIGKKVLDILKQKSLEGVDVYLIYDHMGSNKHLDRKYMNNLKKSGVKIGIFDPQTISIFNSNLNFRNHRKATVVDGKVGFIGGMNLGDEYNHQDKKFGFWRDTHVVLKGNGVTSIQNVFVKDWYYITNQVIDKPMYKTPENSEGFVSIIESGPDFENSLIRNVYFKMISSAKKSIKIVTPYLIVESELMLAIDIALKSGVKVELLVPGLHDYIAVGFATESYYENLLRMGVRIYEYDKHFVHSKILIIDNKLASVGSVNFDPRSFHLNFEVTSIFENEAVSDLVKSFKEDLKKSNEVILENWQKRSIITRIIQGLFNLFSPIF